MHKLLSSLIGYTLIPLRSGRNVPETVIAFQRLDPLEGGEVIPSREETGAILEVLGSERKAEALRETRRVHRAGLAGPDEAVQTIRSFQHGNAALLDALERLEAWCVCVVAEQYNQVSR